MQEQEQTEQLLQVLQVRWAGERAGEEQGKVEWGREKEWGGSVCVCGGGG